MKGTDCLPKGGNPVDDQQIIALYWDRDQAAITESGVKYGPLLHSISYHILSSHEDSEECVNDTYGKAWDTMPPKRPDSLAAYLGRIVRNLSLNRWHQLRARKRGRDGGTVLLSELADCVPASQSVEETVEAAELTELIRRWLEALPQEDRVLFLRRYWFCDPVNQLAEAAGTTPNKLAGRLYRLRQKLRVTLEQEGISL